MAEAAYQYGQDGNMFDQGRPVGGCLSTHTMEAADFLALDKGYIEDAVNQLGADLESTLTQPTAQVEGQRPDLSGYEGETGQEQTPIIPENGQTLILRSGQPGRHLDTQALEDRF